VKSIYLPAIGDLRLVILAAGGGATHDFIRTQKADVCVLRKRVRISYIYRSGECSGIIIYMHIVNFLLVI
jgi:hypothetical protein